MTRALRMAIRDVYDSGYGVKMATAIAVMAAATMIIFNTVTFS